MSSRSAEDIAKASKHAFEASQLVTHEERVKALERIHDALAADKTAILDANAKDMEVRHLASTNLLATNLLRLGSEETCRFGGARRLLAKAIGLEHARQVRLDARGDQGRHEPPRPKWKSYVLFRTR